MQIKTNYEWSPYNFSDKSEIFVTNLFPSFDFLVLHHTRIIITLHNFLLIHCSSGEKNVELTKFFQHRTSIAQILFKIPIYMQDPKVYSEYIKGIFNTFIFFYLYFSFSFIWFDSKR